MHRMAIGGGTKIGEEAWRRLMRQGRWLESVECFGEAVHGCDCAGFGDSDCARREFRNGKDCAAGREILGKGRDDGIESERHMTGN